MLFSEGKAGREEEEQLGTQERKQTPTTITTEKSNSRNWWRKSQPKRALSTSGSTSRKFSDLGELPLDSKGRCLLALYLPPEGITVRAVKQSNPAAKYTQRFVSQGR